VESFKEFHTCDVRDENKKSTSYDGAIVEVTDLREGGDVRGSPLIVIEVPTMSKGTYHAQTSRQSPWCTF
jgi:hypothetical protein